MPASKIGGRWLIERGVVEKRRRQGALKGRPFAAHNAWALLYLASGEDPGAIDPSVRSRLRRAIRMEGLEVSDSAWHFLKGAPVAPIAAVALDLAEDPDPRSSQAGRAGLNELPPARGRSRSAKSAEAEQR
jgi:hypothetical protein